MEDFDASAYVHEVGLGIRIVIPSDETIPLMLLSEGFAGDGRVIRMASVLYSAESARLAKIIALRSEGYDRSTYDQVEAEWLSVMAESRSEMRRSSNLNTAKAFAIARHVADLLQPAGEFVLADPVNVLANEVN